MLGKTSGSKQRPWVILVVAALAAPSALFCTVIPLASYDVFWSDIGPRWWQQLWFVSVIAGFVSFLTGPAAIVVAAKYRKQVSGPMAGVLVILCGLSIAAAVVLILFLDALGDLS